jgi:hypothetical protein
VQVVPVLSVLDGWRDGVENLGSKEKFWVIVPSSGQRALFKVSRPGTCEHASEFLAARVARALGVECAEVELAECDGAIGCLSYSIVRQDHGDELIHGNAILSGLLPDYDAFLSGRYPMHTVENIASAIRMTCADQERLALRSLARLLILDAVIGNTDRHHENWGVVSRVSSDGMRVRSLAPLFDNASSLGRELSPAARRRQLRDRALHHYWTKASSAIWLDGVDRKVHPIDVLRRYSEIETNLVQEELARVRDVDSHDIESCFRVFASPACPEDFIEFSREMVAISLEQVKAIEVSEQ